MCLIFCSISHVDYVRPVEALIPGVQGRVLGVLARTGTELTIRAVADLARVSTQQASVVIAQLAKLGVIERRDVGTASLVVLSTDNLAAQAVRSIANLRHDALERAAHLASAIMPAPASLVVFGSFARGEADPDSDVDVLAVRPAGLPSDDNDWTDSLGRWVDQATRIIGNPVNLIETALEEIPELLERNGPSLWQDAAKEGVVLVGSPISTFGEAA